MKPITLISILAVSAIGAYFIFRNLPPEPLPDTVSTNEQTVIEIPVLMNDNDPNNDVLRVSEVDAPDNGEATVSANGQFIHYTPESSFFGKDTFAYRVVDPDGAEAESMITVDVKFTAPDFHQRHEVGTLAEMLNEPPTSIYGSTIDVFLYQDTEQNLREITISGHADSITCGATSGSFASALMYSNAREGDFLLSGAGRMAVPKVDPFKILLDVIDPDVNRFISLSRQLSHLRFQIDGHETSVEEAETKLGMSLNDGQKELDDLEKRETVIEYVSSVRPLAAALAFKRQAVELAERSGLLRLHEVPYSIVESVTERIRLAAQSGEKSVIQFSDFLPTENSEAVAYIPMMYLSSAEPVVLRISAGEFSPEGLAEAAKLYRSELEAAVIGSAERRLRHANRLLKRSQQQAADCKSMTEEVLNEVIRDVGWEICDRDTCVENLAAPTVTNREYCDKNVPNLLEARSEWKQEAQEIISRIKLVRQEQYIDRIDAFTHAALVDSMLREWALPFPQAQAAFDHWLEEGRVTAWKSITNALQDAGIGRSALSGESLIFDIRLIDEMLEIRPLMVVDVRRSHVVIEPKLAVTALVNPWELRKVVTSAGVSESQASDIGVLLLDDPATYAALISSKPRSTASSFIDRQLGQLPVDGADWDRRREEALRGQARLLIDDLSDSLNKAHMQSPEEAWSYSVDLTLPMYLARHAGYMGARYRLNVAHSFLRAALVLDGQPKDDAWDMIRRAYASSNKVILFEEASELLLLGDSFGAALNDIFELAAVEDPDELKQIIDQAEPPEPPSREESLLVRNLLTQIVSKVEEASSALAIRSSIERAINTYEGDGSVRVRDLEEALVVPTNIAAVYNAKIWEELTFLLRIYSRDARLGRLGPIEGNKFLSDLSHFKDKIDRRLRESRPMLSSFRFGHDQEAIVTRLLFDEGAYAEAFERLTPTWSTVAQYHPDLRWTPIETDLKGLPDEIAVRIENDGVVISASIGGKSQDVLRLDGLAPEDRKILIDNPPKPTVPWNEGDPLWEQMLIAEVPARPAAKMLASVIKSDAIYLAMLKAMVYACAVPATHILEKGGRCAPVSGLTRLHDRVQDSEVASFIVPDISEMKSRANERFNRPRAWRFETATLE